MHLGIDAQALEIRAIEMTDNAIGDAPTLPGLIKFQWMSPSPASVRTAHMTRKVVTKPLRCAVRRPCPAGQKRTNEEGVKLRNAYTQSGGYGLQTNGPTHLENLAWLSPSQFSGNQDALLQSAR